MEADSSIQRKRSTLTHQHTNPAPDLFLWTGRIRLHETMQPRGIEPESLALTLRNNPRITMAAQLNKAAYCTAVVLYYFLSDNMKNVLKSSRNKSKKFQIKN